MWAAPSGATKSGEGVIGMKSRIIAVLMMATMALSVAQPAFADGVERSRHGTGTMGSRWELDVEDEGRYLSGDVEVERLVRDHAGADRIVARGVNLETGEVCRGALTI
jgi:hypothetical protein